MTINEINLLLSWLKTDPSIIGFQNYAITFMLITSGLRASELCQLKWKDLDFSESTWSANFTGKGNKPATQELYTKAVEACLSASRSSSKGIRFPMMRYSGQFRHLKGMIQDL